MRKSNIYNVYTGLYEDKYYLSSYNVGLEQFEIDYINEQFDSLVILSNESLFDDDYEIVCEGIWSNIVNWVKRNWEKLSSGIKNLWNKLFKKKEELKEVKEKIKTQSSKPKTPANDKKTNELVQQQNKIETEVKELTEQVQKDVKEIKPNTQEIPKDKILQNVKSKAANMNEKVLAKKKKEIMGRIDKLENEYKNKQKARDTADKRYSILENKYSHLKLSQKRKIKEYTIARSNYEQLNYECQRLEGDINKLKFEYNHIK